MNLYIFEYLPIVSTDYHPGGGAVIIAPTLTDARDQYREHLEKLRGDEWASYDITDDDLNSPIEPDHVFEVAPDTEPKIIVFPDAGCC